MKDYTSIKKTANKNRSPTTRRDSIYTKYNLNDRYRRSWKWKPK